MPITVGSFLDVFAGVEQHDRRVERIMVNPRDLHVLSSHVLFGAPPEGTHDDPWVDLRGTFCGALVFVDVGIPLEHVYVWVAGGSDGTFYPLVPEQPPPEPEVYRPTVWERLDSGVDTE